MRPWREGRPRGLVLLLIVLLTLGCLGCGRQTGQLISSWTLAVPGHAPVSIEVPARLGDVLPNRSMSYELKATVNVDRDLAAHDVEFVLPCLAAHVSLRVNGEEMRLAGDPELDAAFGGSTPRRWLLPRAATSGDGPITFELEVEHRWSQSARIDVPAELVVAGTESPLVERNRLINQQGAWFGVIALSQVGITFLAVYFWDRRRRAYLWFAIQALTASYYPAFVAGIPVHWLGPWTQNMLLAQSLAVAPIISVYFTHAFFGLPRPNHGWAALLMVGTVSPMAVVAAATTAGTDFLVTTYSAVIVVVCVVAAIGYQLVIGVRLLGSYADRGIVVFFLCCWLALGGSSWVDLLTWAGGPDLLQGARPACVGLGLFGIFQSMLLSRSHFRSLIEADLLNDRLRRQVDDLEERGSEIETLNEELRRQIGRRTADVLAALTDSDRALDITLQAGDIVEGRYRVVRALGVGGMGAVYEVERVNDGKRLALKLAQEVRGLALARLAREARIASQIHHPNVVSIVDADVAQGGYAYLVMELVEGQTLAEGGKKRGMPWRLEVLFQVLQGVKALHAQGIIHRDLKPSNILLSETETSQPRVKITDFGISRWLDDEPSGPIEQAGTPTSPKVEGATMRDGAAAVTVVDAAGRMGAGAAPRSGTSPSQAPPSAQSPVSASRSGVSGPGRESRSTPQLTRAGQISGTPAYVAPELADGTAFLSPAVDVYSFGVVAYGLLSGKPPYLEAPFLARLEGREVPDPAPLGSQCSALNDELTTAIDACLALTAGERPGVAALMSLVERELVRVSGPAGVV
jgi:serine/threonine protein kinase